MHSIVEVIVTNAERLLADARILNEKNSFASAVSLSVLSMEESGKACLLKWHHMGLLRRDIRKEIRSGHINKQRIFGAYNFAKAVLDSAFFDSSGKPIVPNVDDEAVIERAAKAGYESGASLMFIAEAGLLDFVKQRGFYVDLDDSLEISEPFGQLQQKDAARHIREAELALAMVRSPDQLHRGMAAIYEIGTKRTSIGSIKLQEVIRKINSNKAKK
jgi:AbiV family abortive infection protein